MGKNTVLEKFKDLLVKHTDELIELPKVLSIVTKGKEYIIGTEGNITIISGKQKSKKSFLTSTLAMAAINPNGEYYKIKYFGSGVVLWFDTEQSDGHIIRLTKRIVYLGNKDQYHNDSYEGLMIFKLKRKSPTDRVKIINEISRSFKNIGLIVIDGIRDLIYDPNDAKESNDIINNVTVLAEDLKTHVITVLHLNKGDGNLRGHIGTEIQNKAETVISVEKVNGKKSKVIAKDCRNEEFPPFMLELVKNGIPVLLDGSPDEVSDNDKNKISEKF